METGLASTVCKKRKVEEDDTAKQDGNKGPFVLVQWLPNDEPLDEMLMWKIPASELTEEYRETLACMQDTKSCCVAYGCDVACDRRERAIKEGRYVPVDDGNGVDDADPFACERWFHHEGGCSFSTKKDDLAHGDVAPRFKKYETTFRKACRKPMLNISEVFIIDREEFYTKCDDKFRDLSSD